MDQRLIAQGAEAKIIKSNNLIIKDRIKKGYRIKKLDESIRKRRTKAEIKLMIKASSIINVPKPLEDNFKNKYKLVIPFIKGKKLSEHLDKLKNKISICTQIGKDISTLHKENIIHGDLTTSNMILVKEQDTAKANDKKSINNKTPSLKRGDNKRVVAGDVEGSNKPTIFFIDFGLGFISHKSEDKAVDLHLLKQALEAKHYKHWKSLWKAVESGYKTSKGSKTTLERLKAVEKRGRYKK